MCGAVDRACGAADPGAGGSLVTSMTPVPVTASAAPNHTRTRPGAAILTALGRKMTLPVLHGYGLVPTSHARPNAPSGAISGVSQAERWMILVGSRPANTRQKESRAPFLLSCASGCSELLVAPR